MFKDLIKAGKHTNMGFPIAEIEHNGTITLVKEKNTGGTCCHFTSSHSH